MEKKGHTLRSSFCKVCGEAKLHEFGNYYETGSKELLPFKECIKCGTETMLKAPKKT